MAVPFRLRLRGYAFFSGRASARATEMGQFRRETGLCTNFFVATFLLPGFSLKEQSRRRFAGPWNDRLGSAFQQFYCI